MTKLKPKWTSVYFGHPTHFWRERFRQEMEQKVDVEELKKLSDIVEYDKCHIQQRIINRTEAKVKAKFKLEHCLLEERRKKLKRLLQTEEEGLIQELVAKQELEECGVCVERNKRVQEYYDAIEREKTMECQKALEREKISRGIQNTKMEEVKLREMQKQQMMEKKMIEHEQEELDSMWHQVLLQDVRRKEQIEVTNSIRRNLEMKERRMLYDEQIKSASNKRNALIREERNKENCRIENAKTSLQKEYAEAVKRKKDQQNRNKQNYEEQSLCKLLSMQRERARGLNMDNLMTEMAKEKLRQANDKRFTDMKNLQIQKRLFTEQHERERLMSAALERESEIINEHWKKQKQLEADEKLKLIEEKRKRLKEEASMEYKNYMNYRKLILEEERENREITMNKVRQTAKNEITRQLINAQDELKKQLEYRTSLGNQVSENQRIITTKKTFHKNDVLPFTQKADSFSDIMNKKVDNSPGRISTNPMHPFARLLTKKRITIQNKTQLPKLPA